MKNHNWKKKTVIAGIAFLLLGSGNRPIHLAAEDTSSPAPTSAESSAPDAASSLDTQEKPGEEKAFHITYQSSSSDMGSVTSAEETGVVSEDSKTVQYSGSEAVPNPGYQFVNWTAEENGTSVIISEERKLVPSKISEDMTYIANFAPEANKEASGTEENVSAKLMLGAENVSGINLAEKKDDDSSRYITGTQISWQDGSNWTSVSSETLIPLKTPFRITVYFSGISTKELRDNYGGILYYDIPTLLKDPYFASDKIMNGNEEAGTISASGNRITIQVNSAYLDEIIRKDGENSTIQNASFTFMATPDQDQIRQNYDQTLVIGDVSTELHFNPNYDSENGTLTLSKSNPEYSEDADGNSYLTYTLTIASGDAAMPDVTVTDHFTKNEAAVEEYIGITESSLSLSAETQPSENISGGDGTAVQNPGTILLSSPKTDTSPGAFTWTIGAMRANETRTLTYRVKLRSGYAGAAGANNGVVQNTATPASGNNTRSSVISAFTPKTGATVSKNAGTITIKDDIVTIPYTVTVTAASTNTWALRNVKISDDFGTYSTNLTKDQLKSVLLDNNGSWSDFKVYSGTDASGNAATASERSAEDSSAGTPYYVVKPSNENLGFNLYIGGLRAGESKTITFNVKLRKSVLDNIPGGTNANSTIQIGNRAGAYSDDTNTTYGNQTLGASNTSSNVSSQQWDRKIQGTAITAPITQNAPASFYSYSDSAWASGSAGESITIPAGSIQYQVAVNEQGLWNVSSSMFKDALSNNGAYLNYSGYLRLDYYSAGLGDSASYNSDQAAVSALSALTPEKTVWLNIDNMTSFSFTPASLGFDAAKTGAYLLTYYAKPVNTSGYSKTTVENSFSLSGTVIGPGGTSRTLSSINVSTNTVLAGSMNFSVSKTAWYGNIQDTTDNFTRGSLYWIITATGTKIPAGLQLKDAPGSNQSIYGDINTTPHVSIAGVYLSSIADAKDLTSAYTQISQLKEDNSAFTAVPDNNWSWSVSNNTGTFTFNNEIDLNNQQLYIIVRTEPKANVFPSGTRSTATFTNALSMRNSTNESYTPVNSADLYIAKNGTNFKEFGEWGTYTASSDGTSGEWSNVPEESIKSGNNPANKILSSWTAADGSTKHLSSGTYIDYRLVVNYAGDEEGMLRLEDVVPKGMEPVYVRYFWTSKYFWSDHKGDTSIQPEIVPITDLGDNWSDIGVKNAALDGGAGNPSNGNLSKSAYGYYDSASRKILIDVSNLTRDTNNKVSTRDIQVQIVMRITDPEVLKGTKKTFNNTMNVYTKSGNPVTSSSTSTDIHITDSISKQLTSSSNLKRNFTITVNPRGEDLLEGSDTLTLVDKHSSALQIDLSTLHVKESADSPDVSFTVQMDTSSNTMTLVIPDNKKLIITYSAAIQAPLGSTVNLSNDAYWYGYSSSSSSWKAENVKVDAGGSLSFGSSPILKILKVDSQNARKVLSGAHFSIYQTDYSEGTFKIKGDPIASGITDSDGVVSFGTDLKYNTVYGIVETQAPAGYVSNNMPVFAGVFRTKQLAGTDVFPKDYDSTNVTSDNSWTQKDLDSWKNVNLYYTGSMYQYTWPNSRASVSISKTFYDGASNNPVSFPSGEFRFGLFYGGNLIQTLTISNISGKMTYLRTENGITESEKEPLFTGLNTNDVYAIYELDDNGNQIKNGFSASVNGVTYKVNYQNDSSALSTADSSVQTFSISNRTSASISVKKIWEDGDNQDGKRPNSVTVQLYADGNKSGDPVTLTASNNWLYTWTGLPMYKDGGTPIQYTVQEITNSYTPKTTTITGVKTWDDGNNQDGKRPSQITGKLLADEVKVDEKTVTEADGWQYSFNNLPVYKNGNKIKYAIAEDAVENYSTTITGYNITNKYTPQQTSLSVLKRWNDSENQDGKRPNSVTVQLLADGKQYGDLVTLNSSGNWMYTWRGLPMYKDGGTPIQYTVQETSTLLTNSYTPKTTTITGVKTWDDGNNQDGKRPSQITVKLLADGIEADRTVAEADENGEWKYSFSNLPKFRNGKEISYSVIEDGVPDYSTQIDGFDIRNSYRPA